MEEQDKAYTKGFNAGYLLSQHEPELLKQLLKTENTSSMYFQGLTLGQKQHDREKLLAQLKQSQMNQDKEKGR
jgi:hypothetical protein